MAALLCAYLLPNTKLGARTSKLCSEMSPEAEYGLFGRRTAAPPPRLDRLLPIVPHLAQLTRPLAQVEQCATLRQRLAGGCGWLLARFAGRPARRSGSVLKHKATEVHRSWSWSTVGSYYYNV